MKEKFKGREELKKILADHQKTGKKIVFTNGCYDLIHVGHVRYLKEAKSHGDILVVAVNSDSSVRKLKGEKRPLIPE
jgi:D-beta-D-heptose 7-phosphate kinase/D-beta-D-heptose 1-phosphate adenosyltransferase